MPACTSSTLLRKSRKSSYNSSIGVRDRRFPADAGQTPAPKKHQTYRGRTRERGRGRDRDIITKISNIQTDRKVLRDRGGLGLARRRRFPAAAANNNPVRKTHTHTYWTVVFTYKASCRGFMGLRVKLVGDYFFFYATKNAEFTPTGIIPDDTVVIRTCCYRNKNTQAAH